MKLPPFKLLLRLFFCFLLSFPLLFFSSGFLFSAELQEGSEVLGEVGALTETQKMLLFAKPSVVQITNIVTGEAIIQATVATQLGAPVLAGRSYPFTLASSGSGFFLTPDGHLITNGHVAKPDEELVAHFAIQQLTETIFKDAVRVLVEVFYGYTPSEQELSAAFQTQLQQQYGGNIENLVKEFYEGYRAGELKITNLKYSSYIQSGVALGSEKKVKELGKAARLVDTLYEGDFDSRDLALLKVEGSNFPTIELGSFENVQIGTEVYAIGYPGVVEKLMGVLTDKESELEPSITKGIISAKKKLVDGTDAFQTDAAITHGNSGGPVIGTDGKVIGVATWGFGDIAGGESFNFMISVEEVQQLLSKNNVTPSESITNAAWEKALNLFSNKYYSAAMKELENVKRLYPDNVDVNTYMSLAQTAIARGEDIPLLFGIRRDYVLIGGGGVLILVVLVAVIILRRRRKKKPEGEPEVVEESVEEEPAEDSSSLSP